MNKRKKIDKKNLVIIKRHGQNQCTQKSLHKFLQRIMENCRKGGHEDILE